MFFGSVLFFSVLKKSFEQQMAAKKLSGLIFVCLPSVLRDGCGFITTEEHQEINPQ